jgi:hypothetical protein
MKRIDIARCAGDSPLFRNKITFFEDLTDALEFRVERIISICREREELARREMALNRELAALLEETAIRDLDVEDTEMLEMMESFVSAVQQVEEHRERVLDQRRIGVIQPLENFIKV